MSEETIKDLRYALRLARDELKVYRPHSAACACAEQTLIRTVDEAARAQAHADCAVLLAEGEAKIRQAIKLAEEHDITLDWSPDFSSEAFPEESLWNSSSCW